MRKTKVKTYNIWIIIYFFFILYGPKFGTYVDTSIIFGFVGIIFCLFTQVKINKRYIIYIIMLLFILMYLLCVMIIYENFDVVLIGRYIRALVSMCSIWLVITHTKASAYDLQNCLIFVLLIHAVAVILTGVINIEWQHDISWFTGYQKKLHLYRSTGLMMGFDMAGLLCILGFLLALTQTNSTHKLKYYICEIVFVFAIFFTSRFSMTILLLCAFVFYYIYREDKSKRIERMLCLMFICLGIIPVLLLLSSTTTIFASIQSLLVETFPKTWGLVTKFISSYNETDLAIVTSNHFDFTELTEMQIIFGSGINGGGDPGYTRMIYAIGIFGLILSMLFYLIIVIDVIKQNKIIKNTQNWYSYRQISFIIVMMFSLMLILDFKNIYFFTTTYFEIFIIEVTIAYKIMRISSKDIYSKIKVEII